MQPINPSTNVPVLDLQGLPVSVTDREGSFRENAAQLVRDGAKPGPSNLSLLICDD